MLNSREIEMIKLNALDKYFSRTILKKIQGVREFIKHVQNGEEIQISIFLSTTDREKITKIIKDLGHSSKIISRGETFYLIINKQILEEIISPLTFDVNLLDLPKGAN